MPEKITHTKTNTTVTETMEKTPKEKGWDTRRKNIIAAQQAELDALKEKNKELRRKNRELKK